MVNSNDFIKGLASQLGRPTPVEIPELPFKVPPLPENSLEERLQMFIGSWQSLGGKGAIVKSPEEAINALKEWFGEQPSWLSSHAIISWNQLPHVAEAAFQKLEWPVRIYADLPSQTTDLIAAAGKAELGVTGADWGIALSGTVVLKSGTGRGRAVSLVPPRHLTFILASALRDNLIQVMEEIQAMGTPPAAIEFISGPSRTSDIEMDLSIGVHGPVEVYVIVIKDV